MPEIDWDQLLLYAIQLGLAAAAGGLVGMQRARRGKSAGMRTHILICVGSAIFMQVSRELSPAGTPFTDPGRIAAQVVTGIGFLGAGTIIRSGFTVAGLTSAATIWAVSGLGLAAGAGLWGILAAGTFVCLATLEILSWRLFLGSRRTRAYYLEFDGEAGMQSVFEDLRKKGASLSMIGFTRRQEGALGVEVNLRWDESGLRDLEEELVKNERIRRVSPAKKR
ncbi:MAG: MgtC/SapB family protein [Planctomycetota bacterium]|jgi:putative Mg2+ transporter-C (MgtC) family protein